MAHPPSLVVIAGGVGGARLAAGLTTLWRDERLTVIVNTGDDFDHLGLRICPDLDTVTYTLAGIGNAEQGWGLAGESFAFMAAAGRLGAPDWFALGDQDLATHVMRTEALRQGEPLSAITTRFAAMLGIGARLVPMSDDAAPTKIDSDDGLLAFQDYFVRRRCAPALHAVRLEAASTATPAPGVLEALTAPELEAVVFCPSNPFVSIAPVLAVPGIAAAIAEARVPCIAVSPIVSGMAIKGPAAKMMTELGMDRSALGIARHYVGVIDALAIDHADADMADAIAALGIAPLVTSTIMRTPADRVALAVAIQSWIRKQPPRR